MTDKNLFAPDDAPASVSVDGHKHPGFGWVDDAACADANLSDFFAQAGHVQSVEARQLCIECPVWRECTIFSYLGHEGQAMAGGYYAALSPGQRKKMNVDEALEYGKAVRANHVDRAA